MTLYQFLSGALEPVQHERPGQSFMNFVFLHRADLYYLFEDLEFGYNAFYSDVHFWEAVAFIVNNWHEPKLK